MAVSSVHVVAAAGAMLLVGGIVLYVVQSRSFQELPVRRVMTVPERPADGAAELSEPTKRPAAAADSTLRQILDDMNPAGLREAPPGVLLAKSEGEEGRLGSIAMNGRFMGRGVSAAELLAVAYNTSRSRMRLSDGVKWPEGRFDYLVSLPTGQKEALQQAIREQLHLTAHPGTREEEVFVLTSREGEFQNRRPSESNSGRSSVRQEDGALNLENISMSAFVRNLESLLSLPIVDESGLRGRFDILLTLDLGNPNESAPAGDRGRPRQPKPSTDTVRKAASEQLGLDLQQEKRELDVLMVESVGKG